MKDKLTDKLIKFAKPNGDFDWEKFVKSEDFKEVARQSAEEYMKRIGIVIDKAEGFVALFDILGFKNLLKSGNLTAVAKAYEQMRRSFPLHGMFNEAAGKEVIRTRNYSDTFLLYTTEISDWSFKVLLVTAHFLCLAAYHYKLPIRGATAVGELYISETVEVGKPLVEAFENERRQDWLGCWITQECIDRISKEALEQHIREKTIVQYPIPLKDGPVKEVYALNWLLTFKNTRDIKSFMDSFKYGGFFEKKVGHGWAEERKHDNTRDFIDFVISLY